MMLDPAALERLIDQGEKAMLTEENPHTVGWIARAVLAAKTALEHYNKLQHDRFNR